jgi:pyruvate dehydrogenase complex dehydrogenase (E1) component
MAFTPDIDPQETQEWLEAMRAHSGRQAPHAKLFSMGENQELHSRQCA